MTAPARPDVRLVVADMDGTLLDADGEVPEAFWPLLERMSAAGVVFAPASGRQYASLLRTFHGVHEGMVFIAENGGFVVRDDEEVSAVDLDPDLTDDVVRHLREVAVGPGGGDGIDLGVVRCGRRRAYVERTDRAFLDHVDPYYASLEQVPDLLAVDDPAVKIAVFTPGDPTRTTAPALAGFTDRAQVVVSGGHWVDLMPTGVDKGAAVRRLQADLGVGPDQTMAFGDMPNDLELLAAATHSYAMAEAHDDVAAAARHRAPSHRDAGVVTVLSELFAPR